MDNDLMAISAMLRDAERYRFIRDRDCDVFRFWRGPRQGEYLCRPEGGRPSYAATMDEAVDAAMKAAGVGEEA